MSPIPRPELEPRQRQRALGQGALGVFGAIAWLFALARLIDGLPNHQETWLHVLVVLLGLAGLALAVAGVWRLSVARDRRWDFRGIGALCLMLFLGIPTLCFLLYLVVLLLSAPGSMFGR
jgi:hypothetical protein